MKQIMLAIMLMAFVGCGGSTPTPSPTPSPAPSPAPSPTPPPSVACDVETGIANGVATLATAAGCTGTAAISAWVLNVEEHAVNFCTQLAAAQQAALAMHIRLKAPNMSKLDDGKLALVEKGALGDVVCPLLITSAVNLGFNAIPADFQCTAGTTVQTAEAWVTTECESLIPLLKPPVSTPAPKAKAKHKKH